MNGTLGCEIRESPCLSRATRLGDNTVQRTRMGSLSQCSDPNFVPVPALADSAAPLPNGKLVTRMKDISFRLDLLSPVSADESSDGSGMIWEWRGGENVQVIEPGKPWTLLLRESHPPHRWDLVLQTRECPNNGSA